MTIAVADVIARVRDNVNDLAGGRFSDERIFRALTDGLLLVATVKPKYFTETQDHVCQAGAHQHVTFTGAISFVEVLGYPQSDFEALAVFRPNWLMDTEGPIQSWAPDETDPLEFRVYPPAPGSQTIKVTYVKEPAPVTSPTGTVPLGGHLLVPLVSFCTGVLESSDDEHVNSNRAAQAKAEFTAILQGA
jgi:hypothetical protein